VTDRISHSGCACTISLPTRRRSTRYRNTASRPTASASTTRVRRADRISGIERLLLYRPYMLLLSASGGPCRIAGSVPRGNLLPLAAPLLRTSLRDHPPDRQGKVRDLYDFGDHLLIVATDRMSAFDHVLAS